MSTSAQTRRLAVVVVGLIALAGAFVGGMALGADRASNSGQGGHERRDFMFQVLDIKTPNQGGQTLNLMFHYRYQPGIADSDLPDYETLRKASLDYLATTDLHTNPYWETLNQQMCRKLKTQFPVEAISCQLQVHGNDTPGTWYEPGYHASIDTIGDLEPLAVPGPLTGP